MNPAVQLQHIAAHHGARPAVSQHDRSWTYAEFADRVARSANYLRALPGAQSGARIALALHNAPGFLQILYACWHAGLCPVPMNAKLHPKEFAYILENAGAMACFASAELHAGIAAELGARPALRLIEADAAALAAMARAPAAAIAQTQPGDPAWLFYTSGTTGRPKGATISQRNLQLMSLSYYADIDTLDERDCIVHAAPLSHGSGLYALPHVARGSHNVITHSGSFAAGELLELIERYERVSFFAAPTMLVRLLDDAGAAHAKLDHLKCIMYGGGPMYVSDLKRALDLFGARLFQIYGQGEAPMTITGLSKRMHAQAVERGDDAALASAGVARSGAQVRIVDDDDRERPRGELGEIVTRGDCVMRGYWQNEPASAQALRGGWLHTGDVGSMDARGFVTLKDRSKDMIISGGSNVYPREVEDVLLTHAGVAQASVVGAPHAQWGEEVVAFIVAKPGAALHESELEQLCLQNIARYKRPKRYIFVDDLPKNNYGKVLKTALRDRLQGE